MLILVHRDHATRSMTGVLPSPALDRQDRSWIRCGTPLEACKSIKFGADFSLSKRRC
jgi:hypothetical protein